MGKKDDILILKIGKEDLKQTLETRASALVRHLLTCIEQYSNTKDLKIEVKESIYGEFRNVVSLMEVYSKAQKITESQTE